MNGLAAVVTLSTVTDLVLEKRWACCRGRRCTTRDYCWTPLRIEAFGVRGSVIAARLAPDYRMRHALVLWMVGFVVAGLAGLATADMNLAPAWYPLVLVVLSRRRPI